MSAMHTSTLLAAGILAASPGGAIRTRRKPCTFWPDSRRWRLIHSEQFDTRAEAMRRERYLKTGRGREDLDARTGLERSPRRQVAGSNPLTPIYRTEDTTLFRPKLDFSGLEGALNSFSPPHPAES